MKRFLLYIFFISITVNAFSQDIPAIRVIGRAAGDSIVIRWSPTTAAAWKFSNKYGYRIERYTIVRDSAVLAEKPLKNILPQPFLPAAQTAWEKFIDKDDFVAIAAQAIYGETFEISNTTSANGMDVINMAQEQESRYAYTLFAADVSVAAANLSGLRFVDRDVKRNERYLYRVYSMMPEKIAKIEMGFTYIGLKDYKALPQITEPTLKFGDKVVIISWKVSAYQDTYTGYYIEKSENGKDFHRINKVPYVNLSPGERDESFIMQMDSLQNNEQTYHYRVVGLTSFAETGPPSKVAQGKGSDKLDVTPTKVKGTVTTNNNAVQLEWEFPQEKEIFITKFEVERSMKADEGFKSISGSIPSSQRKYVDQKPLSTNYYRITAFSKDGKPKNSFPILVQKEDSIPPLPPQNVTAKIDTAGIVSVQWSKNQEEDLNGYRVYRSNFANSEFSQITVSPLNKNAFTDTLNLKTLTKKIYYKVTAVDNRFNTSAFSSTIQLTKPDIIPPTSPLFKEVKATEKGIEIKWISSSSEDIKDHRLYRRAGNNGTWEVLKTLGLVDSLAFLDQNVIASQLYEYKITAIDDAGLESPAAGVATIKALKAEGKTEIKKISAQADRQKKNIKLDWSYQQNGVTRFQIFRAIEGEPISLYKVMNAADREFTDQNVSFSTTYVYRIKALFSDGTESKFSEEIKIIF
jgi:fibronectin type 3 domain-containing protein